MMFIIYFDLLFFFFKQKTAYEMRISDWSSDVCSSDLRHQGQVERAHRAEPESDVAQVVRRVAPRTDAGHEAAVLLQVLGGVVGVEHDAGVEVGEKDDQRRVERQEQRLDLAEVDVPPTQPLRSPPPPEPPPGPRQPP